MSRYPRGSQKEDKAVQFIKNIGLSLGLETTVDPVGNVLIKKPATKGMEDRCTVALQAHIDMVQQKKSGLEFDFDKDAIQLRLDGDWVRAEGTTLGADNGIGVATILAILSLKDIVHPPLEALFTVDEELGMTGVAGLSGDELEAEILLNLDEEIDQALTIGCAGGVGVNLRGKCKTIEITEPSVAVEISIKGLLGGHSGDEIHLGRINSIKLLSEILIELSEKTHFSVHSIYGGDLPNVIPTEAKAVIVVPRKNHDAFTSICTTLISDVTKQHQPIEPDISLSAAEVDAVEHIFEPIFQKNVFQALSACPSGVYRMNPSIADRVQSSNNLASVLFDPTGYEVVCNTRSSLFLKSRIFEKISTVI